jgi:cysteine dioxygenase
MQNCFMISIEKFIDELCSIPEQDFTCDNIYQFIAGNPIDVDSIAPFFFWSERCYTRNLIYKDERFELMTLCWERGQVSRIHNHADQMCWMTVPVGRLRGQNFSVLEIDEAKGFCRLKETDRFELSDCLAAKVELEEPIHQILNLPEFNQRAVSLHIYSKPFDKCLSYCRETDKFAEVPLFYTSINGKLCDGVKL